jgi:hypothetical protein
VIYALYNYTMPYEPQNFSDLYATPLGPALWDFLHQSDNVIRMETASLLGKPAVEPLSTRLLEEFGSEIAQDRTKQMIGHMVRQTMESLGYIIEQQGVRIVRNRVFSTGTRYAKPSDPGKNADTMRITREQRENWLRNTCHGEFNLWLDPQVRNPDGTLCLEKLYGIADQYGIDPTPYQKLNPGQQRMILGIKLRSARKLEGKHPC